MQQVEPTLSGEMDLIIIPERVINNTTKSRPAGRPHTKGAKKNMKKYESMAAIRKDLVKAVGEITGEKPKYSGVPKCEYTVEGFTIDRDGNLLAEDSADQAVIEALATLGLIAAEAADAGEGQETVTEAEAETEDEPEAELAEDTDVDAPQEAGITAETEVETEPIEENEEATEDTAETEEQKQDELDVPTQCGGPDEMALADVDDVETDTEQNLEPDTRIMAEAELDELADGTDGDEDENTENDTEAGPEDAQEDEPKDEARDGQEGSLDLNMDFEFPLERHNGVTLRNLVNLIYSRGKLIGKATGGHFHVEKGLVEELKDDRCTFAIANFLNAVSNYEAQHGEALEGLKITPEKIIFTGFPTAPDHEHLTAFGHLAILMNWQALTQKRIQAKEVAAENEKYALRIWLLRLGMNGPDFKETRKILMENLSGHAAFRTDEEAKKFLVREKAKRDALKAAKQAAQGGDSSDGEAGASAADEPTQQNGGADAEQMLEAGA